MGDLGDGEQLFDWISRTGTIADLLRQDVSMHRIENAQAATRGTSACLNGRSVKGPRT